MARSGAATGSTDAHASSGSRAGRSWGASAVSNSGTAGAYRRSTLPFVTSLRIGHRFQGPSGTGQGGWTSALFERTVGEPLTISITRGIPLETDLEVFEVAGGWELHDDTKRPVMTARPRTEPFVDTEPVSIDAAADARRRFPAASEVVHPVPDCFSCGPVESSMGVHAGPLDDGTGRFAVDWTVPDWAQTGGEVDSALLWTALDCTTAWYVGYSDGRRPAFTVGYAAEVLTPLEPGQRYAVVAWSGDYPVAWDGRKRGGAAAAFDRDGRCVGRARSFWVAAALDNPRIAT